MSNRKQNAVQIVEARAYLRKQVVDEIVAKRERMLPSVEIMQRIFRNSDGWEQEIIRFNNRTYSIGEKK